MNKIINANQEVSARSRAGRVPIKCPDCGSGKVVPAPEDYYPTSGFVCLRCGRKFWVEGEPEYQTVCFNGSQEVGGGT